jgi:RHS repeat-associated protein
VVDKRGNRLSQSIALNGGAPTVTNYSYDDANRLSNAGYAYDNAGRMTSDGTNTYTWDRAGRLLSMGGSSYAYDGAGRRIRQTVGANTTHYLLDVSMGLWETLVETTGTNATRYLHDPRGLLSQQRPDTSWQWALNDGLGSVRGMLNGSLSPQDSRLYAPYGETTQLSGTAQTAYGYTGEATDGNGLVYLRNRYYAPGIGQFISIDPLETANRYAYVGGNVVNATDPSGLVANVRPRMIDVDESRAVMLGTRLPQQNTTSHGNNSATVVRPQNTTNPGSNFIGAIAALTNFAHNIGEAIRPITPVVSNTVAGVQQAILQVGFGVTLTSQQPNSGNITPANFSNRPSGQSESDLWTADQVNTLFQTVAKTAQTYGNLVPNAPEGRSTPPNPFLLFQQINGPMEIRLQPTQIMQVNFDSTQCPNAAAGRPNYAGETGTAIFGLTCPKSDGGSIIHLAAGTNGSLGAFGSQNYPPSGDGRLSFNAEFLIAHEMAHAADFYSGTNLSNAYFNEDSDTQIGMPGTRATSVGSNNVAENFADAVANLVTGGFLLDPSLGQTTTEDQAQRQEIVESVLRAAILDNGFGY